MWTPEEHESFVQELKKYPVGDYGWIAETIGTKFAAEVTSYAIKCWESDEYQQVVARRQQKRTRRPRYRVRKWLRAALDWCVQVFSLRCLPSRHGDEAQATARSTDVYSPGISSQEPLRPRPTAGPAPRGSIFIPPEEENDEDDLGEDDDWDMRLAHQTAEQIEWYKSGSSRSAPKSRSH
ncbi:hypothetical protein V7S43_002840 [Phytophthora oleae]|uniref:SANT domain-containing protein n=1 Tax=Phytophthora oleae TaxID=2107226 RepID=A0ABD3G0N4_9STRA